MFVLELLFLTSSALPAAPGGVGPSPGAAAAAVALSSPTHKLLDTATAAPGSNDRFV